MGKDHRWHASSEEDQSNCGTDRVGNLNPKPARREDGGAGNAQTGRQSRGGGKPPLGPQWEGFEG